ncbi:hypothetical protein SprV_0200744100 [Sparganum proliferum]
MRTHLYSSVADLTKAFDTVNREGLWKIIHKFGCPKGFNQMMRQLHSGMIARVTDNEAVSEAFSVTNRVKQGCVLAPTLFSLLSSVMLMDAYREERPEIRATYRTDDKLLNHRQMYPQLPSMNCSSPTTAPTEEDMQRGMYLFPNAATTLAWSSTRRKWWLCINPPHDAAYVAPQINVNGAQLRVLENIAFLDSALSRSTKIDDEVARRTSIASQDFGRLLNTGWNRHGLQLFTKLKMCKAVILPALLYG